MTDFDGDTYDHFFLYIFFYSNFSQKIPKIISDKKRIGHVIGKSDSEAGPPRSQQV